MSALQTFREIPLTQGKVALVDEADYGALSLFNWFAEKAYGGRIWYAARGVGSGARQRLVRMHAVLLGQRPDCEPDHRNGNGLDNRRQNLRWATGSQQMANRRFAPGASGYRGVYRNNGRWMAQFGFNKRNIYCGTFGTPLEAAHAYNEKAQAYHGEFAVLNLDEKGNPL
jgi:hypothetical protein